MAPPSNPRLQRTPSALPPSPLSRKPLGGGWRSYVGLCLGLGVMMAFLGCVTVAGRLKPDWGSYMDIQRTPRPAEVPLQPLMLVIANDLYAQSLPGVKIALEGPGQVEALQFYTAGDGTARPTVGPGNWHVTASLTGFKPVSRNVVVRSGERCVVRAYLRPVHLEMVS